MVVANPRKNQLVNSRAADDGRDYSEPLRRAAFKGNPTKAMFAVVSVLLFLTCVKLPELSVIHEAGSLIFVGWLWLFVTVSLKSVQAGPGEY